MDVRIQVILIRTPIKNGLYRNVIFFGVKRIGQLNQYFLGTATTEVEDEEQNFYHVMVVWNHLRLFTAPPSQSHNVMTKDWQPNR